ncbi:MAG: tetratricopeptide repeat protein [Deltaproteobacteria bacterium]|nr:tetratricopeptide repeat protein [Deltaproteobacteria bacterium]
MRHHRAVRSPSALLAAAVLAACAHSTAGTTANAPQRPPRRVTGDGFRVVANPDGTGDAYDATVLFERATEQVRAHRCELAIPDYERLEREFPSARVVYASAFNRGLCLQLQRRYPDAREAFQAAGRAPRDPDLVRDAALRLAAVGEAAQEPRWVLEGTDVLLARPRSANDFTERTEALARRAAALLALGDRDNARRAAEEAVTLAPTPEAISALDDDTFAAQARFVLAELTRLQSEAVAYRIEAPDAEDAITRRVQLVTHAHVQYNDVIRVNNPDWAAAAGFRIGALYRDLYRAIVEAPPPADWGPQAREVYRQRTGDRLRPLVQGALRSWEATLSMARRNGIQANDWVRQADRALEELRQAILDPPAPTP